MNKEQVKEKQVKEKIEKKSRHNHKLIALIIFSLIISLPIATTYLIAQSDFSQGVIEVTEA